MIPLCGKTVSFHNANRDGRLCRYPNLWRGIRNVTYFGGGPIQNVTSLNKIGVAQPQNWVATSRVRSMYGMFAYQLPSGNTNRYCRIQGTGRPSSVNPYWDIHQLSYLTLVSFFAHEISAVIQGMGNTVSSTPNITQNVATTIVSHISVRLAGGNAPLVTEPISVPLHIPICTVGVERITDRFGYCSAGREDGTRVGIALTGTRINQFNTHSIGFLLRSGSGFPMMSGNIFLTAMWNRALQPIEAYLLSHDPMVLLRPDPGKHTAFRWNIDGIAAYIKRRKSANV